MRGHRTQSGARRPATLHLLPTLWFRNTWSLGRRPRPKPSLSARRRHPPASLPRSDRAHAQPASWAACKAEDSAQLLFWRERDQQRAAVRLRLIASPLRQGRDQRVHRPRPSPRRSTRGAPAPRLAALPICWRSSSGESASIVLRLSAGGLPWGHGGAQGAGRRRRSLWIARPPDREADQYYATVGPADAERRRQIDGECARRSPACCGASSSTTMTSHRWLPVSTTSTPAPPERHTSATRPGITCTRRSLSMPDKWEYPWFAAWDLAFHYGPLSLVDPEFAKEQLELLLQDALHAPQRPAPRRMSGTSATSTRRSTPWAALYVYEREAEISWRGATTSSWRAYSIGC